MAGDCEHACVRYERVRSHDRTQDVIVNQSEKKGAHGELVGGIMYYCVDFLI